MSSYALLVAEWLTGIYIGILITALVPVSWIVPIMIGLCLAVTGIVMWNAVATAIDLRKMRRNRHQ